MSETKNAQFSQKQKNNNNKNLKTYHYHYPMRTGLSLGYRYVILKHIWNELSSTDWKVDVRVKQKMPKTAVNKKNKNNKNLKTYHYHYLMRTELSLSYRYVILKYVWNELSSIHWKIDVRVKRKMQKSAVNKK